MRLTDREHAFLLYVDECYRTGTKHTFVSARERTGYKSNGSIQHAVDRLEAKKLINVDHSYGRPRWCLTIRGRHVLHGPPAVPDARPFEELATIYGPNSLALEVAPGSSAAAAGYPVGAYIIFEPESNRLPQVGDKVLIWHHGEGLDVAETTVLTGKEYVQPTMGFRDHQSMLWTPAMFGPYHKFAGIITGLVRFF